MNEVNKKGESAQKKNYTVLVTARNDIGREPVTNGIEAETFKVDSEGHLIFYVNGVKSAVFHRNYWLAVQAN